MARSLFFVGCVTRPGAAFPTANGQGISGFWLDDATGAIEPAGLTDGIDNPTFVAVDPSGRTLCATTEVSGWFEGTVSAYAIDKQSGQLRYLNKQPARGDITAHLDFDNTGRFLSCANYGSVPDGSLPNQSIALYQLDESGALGAPIAQMRHLGQGPDTARQERPHAHSVHWSPDNRFMVVADLGIDRLVIYRFANGTIAPHGELVLPAGSGPRHFLFHPSRPFAYVICELNSTLYSLSFDADAGRFAVIGSDLTVPADAVADNYCSTLQFSADGRSIYAGNRGHDSIARLDIDPTDGVARFRRTYPSGGKTPRDFALDPSGKFLVVANQNSDGIAVLQVGADGDLVLQAPVIASGSPMAIAFVRS